MFGRGNVKLEATITIDISKTGAFFPKVSVVSLSGKSGPLRSAVAPGGHTHHLSSSTSSWQSLISLTEVTAEALAACHRLTFPSWASELCPGFWSCGICSLSLRRPYPTSPPKRCKTVTSVSRIYHGMLSGEGFFLALWQQVGITKDYVAASKG